MLSIITINYNNINGLQNTLKSVFCQSRHDFEWIVIDGGSTDGSKELLEKYTNRINYWVSEPDHGIYEAMNKGIKVAKGDYLQFLTKIGIEELKAAHITNGKSLVKILGKGELKAKLEVEANAFSKTAEEAIKAVGGNTTII